MKLYILSDWHCGKYTSDSDKWINNMKSYFYNWLIPTLKEYMKPGDKLIILGDVFDNRTSINLKVINFVVKLFEDLSKIIEIHSILGNHDMFAMSDPEINSACTFRNINNVYIYEQPTLINFNNKEILLMPWINGKNDEKAILEQYKGQDLLLCHSDLNGCRTQLYPTRPHNRHILDIEDFNGYTKVFSGHIHIQQTINNFTFVGSPYHLDRNDIDNPKGLWIYNTKNEKDIFIENDYSPQFKKIKLIEDKDLSNINTDDFNKNFIDLEISKNLILNNPKLKLTIEKLINKHSPNDVKWIDDIVKETKTYIIKDKSQNKSIKDWSTEWVDNLKINQNTDIFTEIDLKEGMKEQIEECFKVIQMKKGT
jgi:DNA repair exonuclease SbcCD nuclease subunit